jgi:transcriptional regulator with XRE-family HTH domain
MRLNRSASWVEKIERGERSIDSIRVVLDLAEALGVEAAKLTGKPIAPPPAGPRMEEPQGVLLQLRGALLHYNGLPGAPEPDVPPRPVGELDQDLQTAWHAYQEDPNTVFAVVWALPDLITETRQAAEHATGDAERRAARRVLAGLYRLAAWEMRHLCRSFRYADVGRGGRCWGGDRAGEVGIITGLRGRR